MYCQDVPSFGNAPVKMFHLSAGSNCVIWWYLLVHVWVCSVEVPCELLELLFMYCQDVPSFGNAPVKMFHLSAGSNCVIWWYLLVHVWVCSVEVPCELLELLELLFMYCQDVPSFGNAPVKMFHLSAGSNCVIWWYLLVHVWVCSVEVPCELLVLLFMYCQDVPSFGNAPVKMYMFHVSAGSNCVIWWYFLIHVWLCSVEVPCELLELLFMYCQDVPSFGNAPVKMFHLSAGSNCVIWWYLLVHVWVCSVEVPCELLELLELLFMYCQDVPSFGNAPVKMFHLSAGSNCVIWWYLLVHVWVCSVEVPCELLELLELLFMYCQDVPSFGNAPVKMFHLTAGSNCVIWWYLLVHVWVCSVEVPCELFVLLFMYCQDVPSFGNAPVKMFHLLAGSNCDIWWYFLVHFSMCSVEEICMLVLLFMYCQDVPSFSRKQQLLYYVVVLFSTFLNLRVICSYSTLHIVFLLCIVKIFW